MCSRFAEGDRRTDPLLALLLRCCSWWAAAVLRPRQTPLLPLAQPFKMAALTSPNAHGASFSSFKGLERKMVLLLLRFTGAKVGRPVAVRRQQAGGAAAPSIAVHTRPISCLTPAPPPLAAHRSPSGWC